MTQIDHTPGPWEARLEEGYGPKAEHGIRIVAPLGDGLLTVCEAVGPANATLIAAAPDQHAAHLENLDDLTGLTAAVEEWLPTSLPGYDEIVEHIDRLTHRTGAAIVKVTGDAGT